MIKITDKEAAPYYRTSKSSTWYIGVCTECGAEKRIPQGHATRIKNGRGTGCRCTTRTEDYTSDLKYRYGVYERTAVQRNLSFSITFDEFVAITKLPCTYCGVEPEMRPTHNKRYEFYFPMSGVDRKDPQRGYETDNVTPCCSRCNYAKWDSDYETFIKHITKIYKYNKEKV